MYYNSYIIIYTVRCTSYCYFYVCGPWTWEQQQNNRSFF